MSCEVCGVLRGEGNADELETCCKCGLKFCPLCSADYTEEPTCIECEANETGERAK